MEDQPVDTINEETTENSQIEKPKTKRNYIMTEARKLSLERMKEGRRQMMEKKQAEREANAKQQAEQATEQQAILEQNQESESEPAAEQEPEPQQEKPKAKPKRVYRRKTVTITPRPLFRHLRRNQRQVTSLFEFPRILFLCL